jgi:hypothetical protein
MCFAPYSPMSERLQDTLGKMLVGASINAIFLYDDQVVITFN